MAERTYYVFSGDNCRFEGLTKEQIIAAIADATGQTAQDVDSAFITKIKEQNKNNNLSFWAGTTAEYNAIVQAGELVADRIYILTDEAVEDEIIAEIQELREAVEAQTAEFASDTGWVDFYFYITRLSIFEKCGQYRVKNGVAYFWINFPRNSKFSVDNDSIVLPVVLDVPTFTPRSGYEGISILSAGGMVAFIDETGTIMRLSTVVAGRNVHHTGDVFSFPCRELHNSAYIAPQEG